MICGFLGEQVLMLMRMGKKQKNTFVMKKVGLQNFANTLSHICDIQRRQCHTYVAL